MKVLITSDHRGIELKKIIVDHLKNNNINIVDIGPNSEDPCDYPDWVHKLCGSLSEGDFGIVICGSGNGVAMTANKWQNIRCGVAWNTELSRLTRLHNDANCLSIPANFVDDKIVLDIVNTFLNTEFEGGRHQNRVNKIPI
jgi:ribose 5-phosphate isomerase B